MYHHTNCINIHKLTDRHFRIISNNIEESEVEKKNGKKYICGAGETIFMECGERCRRRRWY